jgi:predicted metal-dependent TIM-barrel fold hydrolase
MKFIITAAAPNRIKKFLTLLKSGSMQFVDKIGEKGYHQLSDEEKQILKRAAEDENL